jgi:hypothetical protein
MATEGLQIKIGADVQSAVTSLNTLNTSLNKTTQTAANVGTAGMNQLTKGTSQASAALTNFSRVASDAPFGLIGIANNIDPLVQSFVSLRKETGSGKAALSALASSLAGGGGLILGISLVTSALQFAQLGLSRWGQSTKEAKEKQDSLTSSFSSQYTEVLLLAKSYENSQNTLNDRKEILSQLNTVSDKYFGNLSAEKSTIEDLQKAYNAYIDNLVKSLAVKQLEQDLDPLVKRLAQAQSTIVKLGRDAEVSGLSLINTRGLTGQALADAQRQNQQISASLRNLTNEQRKALSATGVFQYNSAVREQSELWKEINDLVNNQSVTFNNSAKNQRNSNAKTKKDQNEIVDILKKYNEQLKSINWDEQNRGIDGTKARLELAGETLRTLYLAGVKESSDAWKTVSANFVDFGKEFDKYLSAQKLQELNKFIESYKLAFKELDIKEEITDQDQLNARINLTIDALIKLKKEGQDNTTQYQELQNTLNNLKAEVGLREIRKRQEEIRRIWDKYSLQVQKLDFNKTRGSLDILKSKIDLIGNTIQDLRSKGWTDKDLGIQVLGAQLNGLIEQFQALQQQREVFESLRSAIEGGLTNAFDSVFNALVEGQDVFKALGDSIKRLALDLVKLVIQMTVVRAIANAIVPGAGGAVVDVAQQGVIRGDTFSFLLNRGG